MRSSMLLVLLQLRSLSVTTLAWVPSPSLQVKLQSLAPKMALSPIRRKQQQHHRHHERRHERQGRLFMSDQWDEEEEEKEAAAEAPTAVEDGTVASGPWVVEETDEPDDTGLDDLVSQADLKTFDDVSQAIIDQKEQDDLDALDGMGAIPGSDRESQDRWRAMVKARTESLGMEESVVSKQAIENMKARAASRAGAGPLADMVDLSQVTYGSEQKESKLSIDYNPEDDLTEEQMKRADPVGQLNLFEQLTTELNEILFPDLQTIITKVVLLIVLGVTSATFILVTDHYVRELYEYIGILPTAEDIQAASENSMRLAQELSTNGAAATSAAATEAATSGAGEAVTDAVTDAAAASGISLPDLGM